MQKLAVLVVIALSVGCKGRPQPHHVLVPEDPEHEAIECTWTPISGSTNSDGQCEEVYIPYVRKSDRKTVGYYNTHRSQICPKMDFDSCDQ